MIAIISAVALEMETLRGLMQDACRVQDTPYDVMTGVFAGKELVTAVCGPGKVNAALCTQELICRFHPAAVINTGSAGALAQDLTIGSVIVASCAIQHDMDTSPLGDPVGFVSGVGVVRFPCDDALGDAFVSALDGLTEVSGRKGVVATGDQFICSAAQKERIVSLFAADCCEMEGAAIAHACLLYHTPCLVVRAMSDQADGKASMSYPAFARMAADNTIRLLAKALPGV